MTRIHCLLLVACAALIAAPAAFAQQRAGGSGHALDANQRAGSGGVNSAENQVDYNARNNVITGNVPGLAAFQGEVPYTAPGEFQGVTGGEQIFQFSRQSLSSSLNQLDAVHPPSYGNYTAANSVYRTFSNPGMLYQQQAQRITGQANAVYSPGTLSQGFGVLPRQENLPSDTLGVIPIPSGQALQVSASPLLGVRKTTLTAPSALGVPANIAQPPQETSTLGQPYTLAAPPQELTQYETLLGTENAGQAGAMGPTSLLGRELQAQLYLQPAAGNESLSNQFDKLQTMLGQQLLNRRAAAGDQVYQQVLQAMRQRLKQAGQAVPSASQTPRKKTAGQTTGQTQTGQPPVPGAMQEPQPGENQLGGQTNVLTNPTPDQLRQAEQQRENAVRKAFGLPPLPGSQEQNQNQGSSQNQQIPQPGNQGQTNQPGANQPSQVQPGQALPGGAQQGNQQGSSAPGQPGGKIITSLKSNIAPLQSLVTQRKGRDNDLMRQAEKQMAAGKYFDAENSYKQVLTDVPGRPLAMAGLINAELGAGLIRSAGFHLHQLYNQHMELIPLRYGKNLLPSPDRLKWVQKQLAKMISDGTKDAEPGLLMAYLGHQVASPSLVRYGLAIAQANHPKDTLLTVLHGVWLNPK